MKPKKTDAEPFKEDIEEAAAEVYDKPFFKEEPKQDVRKPDKFHFEVDKWHCNRCGDLGRWTEKVIKCQGCGDTEEC